MGLTKFCTLQILKNLDFEDRIMANSPRGLLPPLPRIDPSELEGEFDTGDVPVDLEEEENWPQLNIEDAGGYIQVDN